MKKLFPFMAVAFLLGSIVSALAVTMYVGSLTTVNNTTAYSTTNPAGSFAGNPGTVYVTNAGLSQTSALVVNLQYSLDGTNFLTVASFSPPLTNAGTYPWSPGVLTQPIVQRFQIVTTNSVMLGLFGP